MDFLTSPTFLLVLSVINLIVVFFAIYKITTLEKSFSTLKIADTGATIKEILEFSVKNVEELSANLDATMKNVDKIFKKLGTKIGHVGFVRFNPYEDAGGDQSFSMALLDDHRNGVIITTLYRRGETRTYSKMLKEGSTEYKLTKEEEEAINQAINS